MSGFLSSLCRNPLQPALWLAAAGMLSACTYSGQDLDRPLTQRFFWTGIVNADDLRDRCAEGGPPSWRAVYNGSYEEQLRIYDLIGLPDGGARLEVRVQETADVSRLELQRPLAPWQWQRAEEGVNPEELAEFRAALAADGFAQAAPAGARLDSRGFYWVVTGCQDGEIEFQVWRDPQDAPLNELGFVRWLVARDETGIALNPPRPFDRFDPAYGTTRAGEGGGIAFTFTVHDKELRGPGAI